MKLRIWELYLFYNGLGFESGSGAPWLGHPEWLVLPLSLFLGLEKHTYLLGPQRGVTVVQSLEGPLGV